MSIDVNEHRYPTLGELGWTTESIDRLAKDVRHRAEYDPEEALRFMRQSNERHNFNEYRDPRY